ncbi:shikimate dehydrogenase [Homoserinibacter sp. YIM 151385]|uniref:shikimate dehydrogenase n=1 Tax=Homoserinibacter sp. YIM 151385 TaxID=2985506 RepID=UPI0022F112BA|nr:shikimate dehydrogenase [Homoserinibacter sp. YIM 151385]WBU38667.1 shikimate dehydrogenase [Homoserinibacter sp. YIM 151385]
MAERRLAVLGSPIAHSRSPQLHLAAYRVLGLDWSYERIEVASGGLAAFLDGLDDRWRGLSLTMPLKREVVPMLAEREALVETAGGANTVLLDGGRLSGFNTDVDGLVAAYAEHGIRRVDRALVLGGGATAASVLVALRRLDAEEAVIAVREPARAAELASLAEGIGLRLELRRLDEALPQDVDAVVRSLPGDARVDPARLLAARDAGASLLDVAYEPWPGELGEAWLAAGLPVVRGLEMLLHQALLQVRIFAGGAPGAALEREAEVLAAMRDAVGLGSAGMGG